MTNFEDSKKIFEINTDGEEFDSDDDALVAGLLAFRKILANRDWKFLKRSYTLSSGNYSLSSITDLDKVLDIWLNGNKLKKASFEQRFDTSYDYYIDLYNNAIVPINNITGELVVDYKCRPDDFTMTSPIMKPDLMCPLIAYQMKMDYLDKDQDLETYGNAETNYNIFLNLLITFNESL